MDDYVPTTQRLIAFFAPDTEVSLLSGGDAEASYLVRSGVALCAFDNLAQAMTLALANCGWGDYAIEEV